MSKYLRLFHNLFQIYVISPLLRFRNFLFLAGLKREGARITTRDGIPRRTLAYFERAIDTK